MPLSTRPADCLTAAPEMRFKLLKHNLLKLSVSIRFEFFDNQANLYRQLCRSFFLFEISTDQTSVIDVIFGHPDTRMLLGFSKFFLLCCLILHRWVPATWLRGDVHLRQF